ncbi:MAG TPA: LamG-like jellyroll fold domain-containing protein [Tepidisphaeraceae bacterium]|nr:LamG-like jellyroll fold domain-containing protein [Tepidisphaeraceae bacterium]
MKRQSIAALALLTLTASAGAAVKNERLYRLGEDDGAVLPCAPGVDPTIDNVSPINAAKVGLEFYHCIGGGGGPPVHAGIAPGSTRSMDFTNVDSRYAALAVPTLVTNYGLEAYVQPAPGLAWDGRFFYNGGSGSPLESPTRGLGLAIQGGQYVGILGGVFTILSGIPAVPNQPVEIAIVADGLTTRLFVQGAEVGSFAGGPLPAFAADFLAMGNFVDNFSAPAYGGVVDEARVFTFLPGEFDPPNDLGPAAVPEPTALAIFSAIGLLASRRRIRNWHASTC